MCCFSFVRQEAISDEMLCGRTGRLFDVAIVRQATWSEWALAARTRLPNFARVSGPNA